MQEDCLTNMYKVIRKQEASTTQVSDNKTVKNFVTKDFSPDVSLAVVENKGNFGEVVADNNRIYYVLEGKLILNFAGDVVELDKGDVCFVSQGSTYEMSGDCKVVTVDQPAFGS